VLQLAFSALPHTAPDPMLNSYAWNLQVPAPGSPHLFLAEKRSASIDPRRPPVLLAHGATFGAALFDLPRPGYSLMAHLASKGRAVYALDVRGYGRSLASGVMDAPPHTHAPFARAIDAAQDLGAAVDFILARHRVPAVDLVGFSWGTIMAAQLAADAPHNVARLVLYAPLCGVPHPGWLGRIADPADPRRLAPQFGAYRWITAADVVSRWNSDLANKDVTLSRENGIAELLFDTLAALDPQSAVQSPPAFRCPNGALADLVEVFNGCAPFDPRRLVKPLLVLRGSEDTTSTEQDVTRLLACADASTIISRSISPGSHFLCIEKNRLELYETLDEFLAPV